MKLSILSVAFAALSAFAPAASALPWYGKPQPRGTPGLDKLAKLMPLNNLPAPNTTLELKFVGLGVGTQNYTCLTSNATAAPGTTGALAELYNIGDQLNSDPLAQWKLNSITGLALSLKNSPKALDWFLQMQGYQKVLGHHFYTLTTPTFSLDQVRPVPYPQAFVTKDVAVNAPTTACPGTTGETAVPWVKLSDKTGASIGGVNTVYRLETAGGSAPTTCQGMSQYFERPYAAQYWVFGPKS